MVLGVSGSIAAYKAPALVRLLRRAGHEVRVVPTAAALRFIGAPALAAVSAHPVSTGLFDDPQAVEHVAVGQWAELVLVAPASADLLARLAAGRADDLLTATVLTTTAPVVLAPAMHTQMWLNPATVDNVATLRRRGLRVIDPASGPLTGADSGVGRLPEPEDVVAQALDLLGGPAGSDADALAAYVGQDVLADLPAQVGVRQVGTAVEMEAAVRQAAAQADAVVMAAAVADYRPARAQATKIKKHALPRGDVPEGGGGRPAEEPPPVITLVENPDVLAGLVQDPPRAGLVVMGFAAETGDEDGDVLAHGAAKARRKGAHLLAVNAVGENLGFGDVPNAVVVLDAQGHEVARARGSKQQVAQALVGLLARYLPGRS